MRRYGGVGGSANERDLAGVFEAAQVANLRVHLAYSGTV